MRRKFVSDETSLIPVEFPLRGEWVAPNTPDRNTPGLGNDDLGQCYTYDFIRVDPERKEEVNFKPSTLAFTLFGVQLGEFYGQEETVYAPVSGIIVPIGDGLLADNSVIIQSGEVFAFMAHMVSGSILVNEGQEILAGQPIGRIGSAGELIPPHLHFRLMDRADWALAKGLPCCFREYEMYRDGAWIKVKNGIPRAADHIRRL